MKVTNVKIRLLNTPRLLAVACVELDHDLLLNDLMLIQGKDGLYVQYPKTPYAIKNKQDIIVPVEELRQEIEDQVLQKYNQKKMA